MQANEPGTKAGLSIAEYVKERFWADLERPLTNRARAQYERILRKYFAPIAHLHVKEVTEDVVATFAGHLAALQLTPAMQHTVLGVLRKVVRTAAAGDVAGEEASS